MIEAFRNLGKIISGKSSVAQREIPIPERHVARFSHRILPGEEIFLRGPVQIGGSRVYLDGIDFNNQSNNPRRLAAEEFFRSLPPQR